MRFIYDRALGFKALILNRFLLNLTRALYIGTSTDESDYLVTSYDTLNLT